ncbi:MAG: ATP-binding cassette domain-containing protein [Burkholderiaceae bacterium]
MPTLTRYEVVIPEAEPFTTVLAEQDLLEQYSGLLIAARPQLLPGGDRCNAVLAQRPHAPLAMGHAAALLPYYRSTMIAALLSNVLMLVTGLTTAIIFDKVIPHQAFVTLWALAGGAMVAIVFDLLARQLRSLLIDTAGKKCDLIISTMLFRQTLGLRLEHRPESAGAHSHHMAQVETVRDFFASATMSTFTDLPFIALFIGMTFAIGGSVGWVLVAAVPVLVLMALLMQRSLHRSMKESMAQQADLQGLMVESLEGMEDIKTTGAQGRFLHRFEAATAAANEAALRSRRISSFTSNVSAVSQQLITLIILIWGVYLIDAKSLSPGAMIACVMFGARAVAPLGAVVSLASRYQGARVALRTLNHLMAQPQERDAQANYVPRPQISGRIGLRDVSFSYPMRGKDKPPLILDGLSLQYQAGERAVILGQIGSGKSTVLRLLAGLYQPLEGQVEVDGMDLRQIDPADFRSQVGFVSQEPRLFKGSLRENILMGRASADASRLTEVATLTGLDRMIAAHPQGWEMPVGEMGCLLSGGQRQLVALARCLITRPRILLMDEPTSSMDAQSELAFLRQLRDAIGQCTLIMITHRPAVLELATRVSVIDRGRLLLDGPKDRVLAALASQRPGARPAQAQAAPGAGLPVGAPAPAIKPAAASGRVVLRRHAGDPGGESRAGRGRARLGRFDETTSKPAATGPTLRPGDREFLSPLQSAGVTERMPYVNWALYLMVLFVLAVFGWAMLARVDVVTRPMAGSFRMAGNRRSPVSRAASCANSNVREGMEVNAGDIVAQLDPTRVAALQARTAVGNSRCGPRWRACAPR